MNAIAVITKVSEAGVCHYEWPVTTEATDAFNSLMTEASTRVMRLKDSGPSGVHLLVYVDGLRVLEAVVCHNHWLYWEIEYCSIPWFTTRKYVKIA